MQGPVPPPVRNAARSPLGQGVVGRICARREGNSSLTESSPRVVRGRLPPSTAVDDSVTSSDWIFACEPDRLVVFPEVAHTYDPAGGSGGQSSISVSMARSSTYGGERTAQSWTALHHLEPIEHWARRFEGCSGAPRRTGHAPPLLEVCRLQAVLSEALLAGRYGFGEEDADWRTGPVPG